MAFINPNMERVSAHKAQASDGPVVMLNLMKLKNPADAQQFSVELREAVDPMSADVGLERIYMGAAGPEFVCGDEWNFVWLVRYPNYASFCQLVENSIWQAKAAAIRDKYLSNARLMLTTPGKIL